MIYFLVMIMTLLGALGAFFFKKSTEQISGIFSLLVRPSFYIGGCCYVSGSLLNILLMRYIDFTVLYPMTAVTYVWTLLISWKFMDDKITKKKIVAVALIFLGVAALTH